MRAEASDRSKLDCSNKPLLVTSLVTSALLLCSDRELAITIRTKLVTKSEPDD